MPAGTILLTQNSKNVVGQQTLFTSECQPGDIIAATVGGDTYMVTVESITSDTALTIIKPYLGTTTGGLGWYVLPESLLFEVPAQMSYDVHYQLRAAIYDKLNWQKVFSSPGNITVQLADGSEFSGPSWKKLVELLEEATGQDPDPGPTQAYGLYRERVTSAAATVVVRADLASHHVITLNSPSCALSISGASNLLDTAQELVLSLKQGTGANLVSWPGNVKWANGLKPPLSYIQGKIDLVQLLTFDRGTTWLGIHVNSGY
ncbi:tail fiber protein [Pseudomonas phage PSA28]|nr:tail fiber protein [Pseudomonas phage PSA28]